MSWLASIVELAQDEGKVTALSAIDKARDGLDDFLEAGSAAERDHARFLYGRVSLAVEIVEGLSPKG